MQNVQNENGVIENRGNDAKKKNEAWSKIDTVIKWFFQRQKGT